MSKRHDQSDLSCTPVDPVLLFRRLACALEIKAKSDPKSIVTRPFPDVASKTFRDEYLLKEVLRKYPGFDLGVDTRLAALSSFRADEAVNAETNDRLSGGVVEDPHVRTILSSSARKAVTVLGKFRSDWFLGGVRFGPGATTRLRKEFASVKEKLSGAPHVSLSAYNLAKTVLHTSPQWACRLGVTSSQDAYAPSGCYSSLVKKKFVIRELDNLTTVSKNAVTDRTIGIAPCMNIYLQLGVGYVMRKRMFPWGINLNDQSINQRRALEGSITGRLATLDIKSASNSVTRGLVWHHLGNHSHDAKYFDPTWFDLLEKIRTQGCWLDGKPHEYELFSAMGNGFTFELESLLFWSLACATCEHLALPLDVTVYGDDIILPVEAVELFTKVLSFVGFRLNADKSFWTTCGPLFRESCGSHYLDGKDVTPFYVDVELKTADQIILLANNIVRWSRLYWGLDGRLKPVWEWVVSHLHTDYLQFGIPFSADSNDGLIMSFDQVRPSIAYLGNIPVKGCDLSPRSQLAFGYRVKTVSYSSNESRVDGQVGLAMWLYYAEMRRFQPPGCDTIDPRKLPYLREPGVFIRGCIPDLPPRGRIETRPPVVKMPIKILNDSRKRTLKVRSRVVRSWPETGPWMCEE